MLAMSGALMVMRCYGGQFLVLFGWLKESEIEKERLD